MDFQSFKTEVSKHFKLSLNSYKETQLKRRIDNLKIKNRVNDYGDYFMLLKKDPKVFAEFMDYITINVSEFFRNITMFQVLEKNILTDLMKNNRSIKIWSAACSNGSEPYSIAMILADMSPGLRYQIEATDIDENILRIAQKGIFTKEQIKGIPPDRIKKYLQESGGTFTIDSRIKSKIRFKKHDLLLDPYPQGLDLIVCRNVTIYFTKEAQDIINTRFHKSLNNGGYLFIGGTENIFNHKSIGFEKVSTCFYRKT